MKTEAQARTAILVSIRQLGQSADPDRVQETRQLIEGLGIEILETRGFFQREQRRFPLGKGQLEELHTLVQALRADLVVFDTELTPLQYRYVLDHLGDPVMDRARLILETFASQAHTAEAKLRVQIAERMFELAQLRAMNAGYDQQAGFIGMRGPGETLFQKRRRARRSEIHELREQVQKIDTRYAVTAKTRQESSVAKIAVVGYTNAGKSTIINLLAKSDLLAEDKPFATLDTAARAVSFGKQAAILVDTVGFIQDLPESLMDSFRSTLEEAHNADLLLHIIDASSRNIEERIRIVNSVLARIGCSGIPTILVFNKIDLLNPAQQVDVQRRRDGFLVSATNGAGIPALVAHLQEALMERVPRGMYVIPFTAPEARADVYRSATVLSERLTARSWIIEAASTAPGRSLPPRFLRGKKKPVS